MSKQKVLIIDGLGLFVQQFVKNPAIARRGNHAGEAAGGLVGFLASLKKICEIVVPDTVLVMWEAGGSARKRSIYADYKQKRRPQNLNRYYEDLPDSVQNRNWQLRQLIDMLSVLPITQYYIENCEADDVIGYVVNNYFKDAKKIIVSSDKDYYQLLDDDVIMYSPNRKIFLDADDVTSQFSISPTNFCLAKSICGDPSDNIPGIDGVGFKTLAKRFPYLKEDEQYFPSDIVKDAQRLLLEGSKIKAVKNIAASESIIKRNWQLIYLGTNNLSYKQIKKIESLTNTPNKVCNKIELMKKLSSIGLVPTNVNELVMSLRKARI